MGGMLAEQSARRAAGRSNAEAGPAPELLSGGEAIERLERTLVGNALTRDPAVADGLALAGVRAASISAGDATASALAQHEPGAVSCVHHVWAPPAQTSIGAVEFAAASLQQAIDHTLAAHRLSQQIGRSACCSLTRELAEDLTLVSLPAQPDIAVEPQVESKKESKRKREEPAASDDLFALAAQTLRAVGKRTGRSADIVGYRGDEDAQITLVAAGSSAALAAELVELLRAAGTRAGVLSLELVRPFPAARVREALADAGETFLLHAPDEPCVLLEALRQASPEATDVRPLPCSSLSTAIEALARLGAIDAKGVSAPDAAPLRQQLIVAPDGPWGRALAHRVLAGLAARVPLQIGRRSSSQLGATLLAWDDATPEREQGDLLLAPDPAVLGSAGVLELMRPGGAVLLLSRASSAQRLARRLSRDVRKTLCERAIRLYWSEPAEDDSAADSLYQAALQLLTGSEDAGVTSPVQSVSAEEISSATAVEEVDFRRATALPRMPDTSDQNAPAGDESRWIEHFHHAGVTACAPVPQPPLRPLVFEGLIQEGRDIPHPFVLMPAAEEASGAVAARGLARVLRDGIESAAAEGRDANTLASNLDALQAIAAQLANRDDSAAQLAPLLSAVGEELVRRLGLPEHDEQALRDDLAAVGRVLPGDARVLRLDRDTPLRLYCAVQSATRAPLERAFAERLTQLCEQLRDLLQLDRMESDQGRSPDALAASLGGAVEEYLDPAALARTLPAKAASAVLDPARRQRIERALATLEQHLEQGARASRPVLLHPPGLELPELETERCEHPDPLAAAVGYYDGLAQRHATLLRAVRTAELEAAGRYEAVRHDDALAALDWQGFSAEEIALVPPLAVVTSGRRLRGREQASLSELLRSSRPVQVLVNDAVGAADEAEDLSLFHLDLGHLVMAHREAFAVSSTLARPERLTEGLARMARAPRPGVAFVRLPSPELLPHYSLLAEAALRGRACPEFIYDPDAGESWADRFDFEGNPEPDGAWPAQPVRCLENAEERELVAPFTFADAVALEPAYLPHLRLIPPEACDDDRQIPLASYLERFDPEAGGRAVPYIWLLDQAGNVQRAVVTRELALACRDRLRAWRVVQELAGYENAYAERAAATAREQALAEAAQERAALEEAHAEALANARGEGARESLEQLATVLLSPDGLAAAAPTHIGHAPAIGAAPGVGGVPAEIDGEAGEEPAPAEEEEEALSFDEAYIDTPLCTSCNECTNINPRLFQYNADKQAFIGDPAAGSFAELVSAAVLCPAHCIHPGKPRSDDSSATPVLIEQAAKFN